MKNAPATFQRLIYTVLRGLEAFAVAYLDDIAVYSCDWESHVTHLQTVMGRLEEAGLTVKVAKCQFAQGRWITLGTALERANFAPCRRRWRLYWSGQSLPRKNMFALSWGLPVITAVLCLLIVP